MKKTSKSTKPKLILSRETLRRVSAGVDDKKSDTSCRGGFLCEVLTFLGYC